ncbi:dienelactone hydrolase family protein [Brevibacterium sp. FME17]|uniref:dienelactone hydrolase family protein n=1 Tax=Brevibacterium sp. FME17 TaxID=2742606 RepID=UPI0018691A6C|nr:dienelactone hydrolase family protein [Brevibacterium sp. FME17]
MAEIMLYHHVQGLTDGVAAFAEGLRASGHTVHVPDMFAGRTFASIEEGFAYARETGFDIVRQRGLAETPEPGAGLVFAGFSLGVTIAQQLAQTRDDARGALLIDSCLPVAEFGSAWPETVPVQIHGKEDDEFFNEDLPSARALADSTPSAELFVYPGSQHLFADSSLDSFDADATALLLDRARGLLAAV